MRLTIWSGAALVLLGLSNAAANAFYCSPMCYCPPPPCCVTYVPKVITCYRTEFKEDKVPVMCQKVTFKQEIIPCKVQVMVPKMYEQQVKVSRCIPVPRMIEREVTTCIMEAVPVFDPCTCCTCMTFRPKYITQKVACTVYDMKVEERIQVVQCWRTVCEDRIVNQVRQVPVVSYENSWVVRYSCVNVPYQTTVMVPVVGPCCK